MADKLRDRQNLEALQARYIGTGSADTAAAEWHANIARDTLASFVGHPPLLTYAAIGLGQSREQTRLQMLEKMVWGAGLPPAKRESKKKAEVKEEVKIKTEEEEEVWPSPPRPPKKESKKKAEVKDEVKIKTEEEVQYDWPRPPRPPKDAPKADKYGFGPDGQRARF
ncbi:SF3b10-domain-containing protein [Trematosphaeria pertusa]|uniref:SF3b10-domain-containing protein n=1 Tax=Trematosphaeria pertusa TaxID=390896 RepID=A0A6A6HV81_9PLEO|nr:SF3b10-domain-containing protein [Trematosphaeria pertusa]KAF2241340.1 SF3b10-domain-containing protein [Trematosphaeria pertusa]